MLSQRTKAPVELVTSATRLHFRNLARSINPPTLRVLCIKAALAGLAAGLVRPDEVATLSEPEAAAGVRDASVPPRIEIQEMRVFQKPAVRPKVAGSGAGAAAAASEVPMVTNAYVEFGSRVHALACQRLLHHNPAYSHHTAGGGTGGSEVRLVWARREQWWQRPGRHCWYVTPSPSAYRQRPALPLERRCPRSSLPWRQRSARPPARPRPLQRPPAKRL